MLALRSAKHSFFHTDLPKILTNNPRKFWKIINPQETGSITLKSEVGYDIGNFESTELFTTAFSFVFTHETPIPFPVLPISVPSSMSRITFMPEGIMSVIKNSNCLLQQVWRELIPKFLKTLNVFLQ